MDIRHVLDRLVAEGWGTGDDYDGEFPKEFLPLTPNPLFNSKKFWDSFEQAGLTWGEILQILYTGQYEEIELGWIRNPGEYVLGEEVLPARNLETRWTTVEEAAKRCNVKSDRIRYDYVPKMKKLFGNFVVIEETVTHEYQWDFEKPNFDWEPMKKKVRKARKRYGTKSESEFLRVDSFDEGTDYDRPLEPKIRTKETVYPMLLNKWALMVVNADFKGSKKNNGKGQERNNGKFGKKL